MKKFIIVLKIICIYIVIAMYVRVGFSIYNYNNNSKIELPVSTEGYILNQDKLSNYRFGVLSANKNCCGAIASYNFLKLNNKEANFNNILQFYDVFGSNVYGSLGVNPFAIKNYLKLKGFNMKTSVNTFEFEELAKKSKTAILVYLYKWGGHYITLKFNESAQMFETYNYSYGNITLEQISDILNKKNNFSHLSMLIYKN